MQTHKTASARADVPLATSNVGQEWRSAVAPWWRAARATFPTFALTHLIFLLLTYFGGVLFIVPNYTTLPLDFKSVLYSWYHWDATRYLSIATRGYIDHTYTAYFPLYPAVTHFLSTLFHQDVLLSGMLVANLSFFAALVVLYRFVREEFDAAIAQRTVLYLSIFPAALFFFAAYAASLFLFFIVICVYTARRGQWWLAGIFGGLAALTDSAGIVLLIFFLCEFFRQQGFRPEQSETTKRYKHYLPLVPALLIPLGIGIYCFALKQQFADPFAFLHPQLDKGTLFRLPWNSLGATITTVLRLPFYSFAVTHSLVELFTLVFFCALIVLGFFGSEKLPKHYWTLLLFNILLLLYALIFPAMPGFVQSPLDPLPAILPTSLNLFVGFIVLARLGRRSWVHHSYLLLAPPLLALMVLQLVTGHWTL